MQRQKITIGNRQAGMDEGTVKRGYRLKQRALYLLPSVISSKQDGKTTIRPSILIALGVGTVFLFLSIFSGASDSANNIRVRLPKLREQYVSYQMATLVGDRVLAEQRWQPVERLLQEIAHYNQLKDQEQMKRKLDELLAREHDKQNPVFQFCNELRSQIPAQ